MNPIQKLTGIAALTLALANSTQPALAKNAVEPQPIETEQQRLTVNYVKTIAPILSLLLGKEKTPPKDYLTVTTGANSLYLTEVDINDQPIGIPTQVGANVTTNLEDSMIGKRFLVEKAANIAGYEQGEVSYTNSDGQKVVVIDDLGNFAGYFAPEDPTQDLYSFDPVDNRLVLSAKSINGGEGTFTLTPLFGGPSYESSANDFGQRVDITDLLSTGLPAQIIFDINSNNQGYCFNRSNGIEYIDGQILTSDQIKTISDDLECNVTKQP